MSIKALFNREKKTYNEQAKQTAARYALGNLGLQVLLLGVIVQCVWLARMGVRTLVQAHQHIFLLLPGYDKLVHFFFKKPALVHMISPFVWPYVPFVGLILLASFLLSYRASRALKRGRVSSAT
jgi:hypothetical protein